MERRLGPGRILIAPSCLAAGILAVAGVANAGSLYQGCDESAGTMFIDGQTGDVDLFAAGYNAATHKVHAEGTRSGAIMSSITCQSSNWKLFTSTLRDKNDRIRADGYGLTGYGPLPASMKTTLRGGNGADRVVGHPGVDDI